MAADVAAYKPFNDHFELTVLARGLNKWAAKEMEGKLIEKHKTRGPAGYNTMRGHPPSTRQFWYLHRRGII